MKKYLYPIATLGLFACSCSSTSSFNYVKLDKDTRFIKVENGNSELDGPNYSKFTISKTTKNTLANVTLTDTSIKIDLLDADGLLIEKVITLDEDVVQLAPKYRWLNNYSYSPDLKGESLRTHLAGSQELVPVIDQVLNRPFTTSGILRFTEVTDFLQTLTIPFKIRGKEGKVPSQVTTSFNAGLAYGRKWSFNKVTPYYNDEQGKMIGYGKKKFVFAVAPFLGLTPVALSSSNTGDSVTIDQTVLGVSFGGTAIFSLNQFNIGLAMGLDQGLQNSSEWIYQGKLWTGIVIGLDIIN